MTPRTGRPTDDPKSGQIKIRISENDKKRLSYAATTLGLSEAAVVRKGIVHMYNIACERNGESPKILDEAVKRIK